MKKMLLFIVMMLLHFNFLTVNADYIVVPQDDFVETHPVECKYHDRYYTSSTALNIYLSPEHEKPYHQADPGSLFWIRFTYTDQNGVRWANQGKECWIKYNDLELVYSHIDFLEEHESSIKRGSESRSYPPGKYVVLYEYPNSDWISGFIDTTYRQDVVVNYEYTDEHGDVWLRFFNGWHKENAPLSDAKPEIRELNFYNPHKESRKHLPLYLVIGACTLTGILFFLTKTKSRTQ